ncbi:hypothetical protein ACH4CE_28520 [Streptomyces gelaticus]|uniref:hypothetical protein n=1 Tax=Streptomyces gelaticus TaxID=285446 RepID=UPI0037B9730C
MPKAVSTASAIPLPARGGGPVHEPGQEGQFGYDLAHAFRATDPVGDGGGEPGTLGDRLRLVLDLRLSLAHAFRATDPVGDGGGEPGTLGDRLRLVLDLRLSLALVLDRGAVDVPVG